MAGRNFGIGERNNSTCSISNKALALVVAGIAGAASMLAWSATTAPASANAQPASTARQLTIATVELQKLMDGLKELEVANGALKARVDTYQTQMKNFEDRMKAIDEELKNTIPKDNTKLRAEKSAEMFEIKTLMDARRDTFRKLLDLEQGDVIKSIYEKVLVSCDTFAKREGYDVILLNDTVLGFQGDNAGKRMGIADVTQVIRSRKLVYVNPSVDVTDRIVTIMNNELEAGIKN